VKAAAVACLEKKACQTMPWLLLEGIGYATELLEHNISISTDAVVSTFYGKWL